MPFENIMFSIVPAITMIFELGYAPEPDEFLELTTEELISYKKQGGDISQTIYVFIPKSLKQRSKMTSNELSILSEDEIKYFEMARRLIEDYCEESGEEFFNYNQKLKYVATLLPSSFSENTPYRQKNLKLVLGNTKPKEEKELWIKYLSHSLYSECEII